MSQKNKVLLLMSLSILFGYVPYYNFSSVVKYLAMEFSLTPADTGLIMSATVAGYVVIVILSGMLADRIGPKKVVVAATLLSGVFSTVFALFAHNMTTILILRLACGMASGGIYPPGMALLSNWFEPQERGGAIGTYSAAIMGSSVIGYFVCAPLAAAYGWRMGILLTSIPVFIGFIIAIFVPEKPAVQFDGPSVAGAEDSVLGGLSAKVLPAPEGGYKGPIYIILSYMGHMWELGWQQWIGPAMVAAASLSGMATDQAVVWGGFIAGFTILVAVPSVLVVGFLADKFGRTASIMLCAICSSIPQFILGYLIGRASLTIVIIVACWVGFWLVADTSIFKAGLTEMASDKIRGTFLGVQGAIGALMTVISPLIVGYVLQYFNGPIDPTAATNWWAAFAIFGVGGLLAPVAAFLLRLTPQAKLMAGGKM